MAVDQVSLMTNGLQIGPQAGGTNDTTSTVGTITT